MSKTAPIAVAFALLAVTAASAAPAASPAVSRFQTVNERTCHEIDLGQGEEVGDELGKWCAGLGGRRIWIWYFDAVRVRLGFGRVGNLNGMFDADRNEAWPYEWRGRMVGRRFEPFAVIARVRPAGDQQPATDLVVWRLTNDGMSCIIDRIPPAPNQNQRARASADRILTGDPSCEAPPDRIDQ
jgi:hypothetical protein